MRLTRILFRVSDSFARLLVCCGVLSAVSLPFLYTEAERITGLPVNWAEVVGASSTWLAAALGAYGLARRKPSGLLLVPLPSLALIATDGYVIGLVYAGLALLVFGSPLALACFEVRAGGGALENP